MSQNTCVNHVHLWKAKTEMIFGKWLDHFNFNTGTHTMSAFPPKTLWRTENVAV